MNIRTLCLGILFKGEATGYEINKLAEEGRFRYFIEASYGSIYPALNKLTEDGLVTWREEQQEGKPARKVYAITQAGREAFLQALYEKPGPDNIKSPFLFLTLYVAHLSPDYVREVIDERIAHIEAIKAFLEDCCCGTCAEAGEDASELFAIRYGIAMCEAGLTFLRNNRHLLENQAGTQVPLAATAPPET